MPARTSEVSERDMMKESGTYEDAEDARGGRDEAVARTAVFGREEFR